MRILLVSSLFPPQNAAGSIRAYGFARCWAEAGSDVTVLTTRKQPDQNGLEAPSPHFRIAEIESRIPGVLTAMRSRHKAESGVNGARGRQPILSMLRAVRKRTGIFAAVRMPDMTDFWIRPAMRWAMEQPGWDAVVSTSGPYTTHLVARTLRRDGRAKVWAADFRDLWCDNHTTTGMFPFTLVERFLESKCLNTADLITTVSRPLADRIRAGGKPVHVIPNGSIKAFFDPLPEASAFCRDGHVRVLYTGTVYPCGQQPEPLLEAVACLRRNDPALAARLRIVVAGDQRDLWMPRAASHGVHDLLEHVGEVDRRRAWHMQRDAHALILLDWSDPADGVLTSKIFEYLSAGPPIIAVGGSPDSLVGDLLRHAEAGVHVGSDTAALARLLADLVAAPHSLRRRLDPGWDDAFSMRRQASAYLELLNEAVAEGR